MALVLLLASTGGCAFFSAERSGPKQVNDLVGIVERVYVEAEVSKERARTALDRLEAIVSSDFDGDAAAAYAEFVTAIDGSEKQAEKLRSAVDPMKDTAEPMFSQWSDDLDQFSSAAMRKHSQARLNAARGRYDAIVSAVDPTQAAFDAFNKGLRDHALFLAHDLNPASLAAIQDDVRNLANLAADLEKRLNECLLSTRAYVETASLPVSGVPVESEDSKPVPVSGKRRTSQKSPLGDEG